VVSAPGPHIIDLLLGSVMGSRVLIVLTGALLPAVVPGNGPSQDCPFASNSKDSRPRRGQHEDKPLAKDILLTEP